MKPQWFEQFHQLEQVEYGERHGYGKSKRLAGELVYSLRWGSRVLQANEYMCGSSMYTVSAAYVESTQVCKSGVRDNNDESRLAATI